MTSNRFDQYNLATAPFDSALYEEQLKVIAGASFYDDYTDLATTTMHEQFLASPLIDAEKQLVNKYETLKGANEAASFQDRLRSIDIAESGEPLVDLRAIDREFSMSWSYSDIPYHDACGEWAGKPRLMWLRRRLAERLILLTNDLHTAGYSLHFEDAFRPTGVQEGLFKRRYSMARDAQPTWTHEQCVLEAQSKTAYTPRFAAHKAGAAADVRVWDMKTNKPVNIGHEYPDGGETVALHSIYVTQEEWQNRMLLEVVAKRAGLTVYPYEDWHLCTGDVTAAALESNLNNNAIYGPIKEFDSTTGEIIMGYDAEELDQVFKTD